MSPKEPVPEPLLRKLKGVFPVNVLQMVRTYHQWADIEWEEMEATLLKEWTSAYEEAVSREIDSQSLKNMVIDRLLEYQSLGITDAMALCYVANSVVDRLEGEYFSSTLTKQVTTNDLSVKIVQDGYQDQLPAPVDDRKEVPIVPDQRETMEATTRQFIKGLPTQAPLKIPHPPHLAIPDRGNESHELRIGNLENVVEKLTVTINKLVVRADADRQRNEAEWQGNKQSEDRLWGTIHRMERDSTSQERIIQKLERSVQFN
ncbi:MAG: hypothetical protein GY702_03680, partial [Desulfobulbaceae bacterium]|nr:hypothetical protein [Desulfobulbaceae bacterium]